MRVDFEYSVTGDTSDLTVRTISFVAFAKLVKPFLGFMILIVLCT